MKPCSGNRKLIAWLVAGALDAPTADALRAHLTTCETCRAYFGALTRITGNFRAVQPAGELPASLHRTVLQRIRRAHQTPAWAMALQQLRTFRSGWRVALPLAGTAIAIAAVLLLTRHPVPQLSQPPRVNSVRKSSPDLEPSIANYEWVAGQSLEQFDDLLTRQGAKSSPAPIYTAGGLTTAVRLD